jgi:hypothetical protein
MHTWLKPSDVLMCLLMQGELIYAKYAIDYLHFKDGLWTKAEIEALPAAENFSQSVYGAYQIFFDMVRGHGAAMVLQLRAQSSWCS